MKTTDIDSLRALCVLHGKRGFVFFHTFPARDLQFVSPAHERNPNSEIPNFLCVSVSLW
jgi:hypothetical protein